MENIFFETLDIDKCKQIIAQTREGDVAILCPNFSINIQIRYTSAPDPEQYQWDWEEFEDALGFKMEVNDFDDLIVIK